MSSPFTGSLGAKRKADLVDIAEALGISDPELKLADLKEKIQSYLDLNEATLSTQDLYKGLYGSRRRHKGDDTPEDSPLGDAKAVLASAVKSGRKSINKVLEKTIDAASIPLPESPLVNRVVDVTKDSVESVSLALQPAQDFTKTLSVRLSDVSSSLVKYTGAHQQRLAAYVEVLSDYLSNPTHLITTSLALELLFLFTRTLQFYEHTLFFPPVSGAKGDFYTLLNSVFGWAPRSSLTIKLPEVKSFFTGEVWAALSWWFSATILPALAGSALVNTSKANVQKGRSGLRSSTSSESRATTLGQIASDPLTFTIFRFATYIFTLTSGAPGSFVDALELSGNNQTRAVAAGLVLVLVAAQKYGK